MGINDFFSRQARRPSGLFGRIVMPQIFNLGHTSINELVKEQLRLNHDDHILEIGFGTGKLIDDIANNIKNGLIEGIDFSEAMFSVACKRLKNHISTGTVILKQGDFMDVSYEDGHFDIVYSLNTIYFWPNPDECLGKIHRILKPGGRIVLAFGDKEQLQKGHLNSGVFRLYSTDEVKELLIRNGFKDEIDVSSRGKKYNRCHCVRAEK